MAPTVSSMLLCSAFLILLSGNVAAAKLNCYWCGPLADQVHLRRNAPSCDERTLPVERCDPGFSCAAVAVSPPMTVSRICMKAIQDDCYPLFCNSSKTLKMVCPCQGNLCNEPNTEREVKAFAALEKLVARKFSSPIMKRSLTLTGKFLSTKENNLAPNEANENIIKSKDQLATIEGNQNNTIDGNHSLSIEKGEINYNYTTSFNDDVEKINNDMSSIIHTIKILNESTLAINIKEDIESDMQSDEPISERIDNTLDINYGIQYTLYPTQIDAPFLPNNEDSAIIETQYEIAEKVELSNNILTTASPLKELKTTKPLDVNTYVKPNNDRPTAEALQHNENPTERVPKILQDKELEKITTEDTTIDPASIIEGKMETSNPPKGNAIRVSMHNFIIILDIIILYSLI